MNRERRWILRAVTYNPMWGYRIFLEITLYERHWEKMKYATILRTKLLNLEDASSECKACVCMSSMLDPFQTTKKCPQAAGIAR